MATEHLEKHDQRNLTETPDAMGLFPHTRRPNLPAQNPVLESGLGSGSSETSSSGAGQLEVIPDAFV
ncbi:unnamed protein product [Phytophthora fragariaefolia]|uniref:Unnamed protein product n=1 Tax=Phytophthora fragariaefolia TaxID=1490495 RepID=A0A9W6Y1U7_9STRA|nr:unnamed protein product [Phytophthora fragariaefolia]